MKLGMANVMDADADHHVTARRIAVFSQLFFGPRSGQEPFITRSAKPWWPELLGAALATQRMPIDGEAKSPQCQK